MKERIESERWAPLQIIALLAPGNLVMRPGSDLRMLPLRTDFGVQSDAGGGLLVESLHKAVKALFAHQQPGFLDKIFGQLYHFRDKGSAN
jgi:hypothetical protein